MANPLDPQWRSYNVTLQAHEVARRASGSPLTRSASLSGTPFAVMPHVDVVDQLAAAERELNAEAVLFLHATFESAIRDDLAAKGALLAAATGPHVAFGTELAAWFADLTADVRMDVVTRPYATAAGPTLLGVVGNIRKYRHWLAHGRRGTAPPAVTPQFTYTRLTQFLQTCGLT